MLSAMHPDLLPPLADKQLTPSQAADLDRGIDEAETGTAQARQLFEFSNATSVGWVGKGMRAFGTVYAPIAKLWSGEDYTNMAMTRHTYATWFQSLNKQLLTGPGNVSTHEWKRLEALSGDSGWETVAGARLNAMEAAGIMTRAARSMVEGKGEQMSPEQWTAYAWANELEPGTADFAAMDAAVPVGTEVYIGLKPGKGGALEPKWRTKQAATVGDEITSRVDSREGEDYTTTERVLTRKGAAAVDTAVDRMAKWNWMGTEPVASSTQWNEKRSELFYRQQAGGERYKESAWNAFKRNPDLVPPDYLTNPAMKEFLARKGVNTEQMAQGQ